MRSKFLLLVGIFVSGGLALFGATQTWVSASLADGSAAFGWIAVTGQQANPSLSPIALATMAAVLALTIAGKGFRVVLGALVLLFGVAIAAIAGTVIAAPARAITGRLSEVTGIAGEGQLDIITGIEASPILVVTLCAGIVLTVLGLCVLLLGRKWLSAGRKYSTEAVPKAAKANDDTPDRISDWESMNTGEDPSEN